MNIKIKELATQARKEVDQDWNNNKTRVYPEAHYTYLTEVEEKLANLIIKECIELVMTKDLQKVYSSEIEEYINQSKFDTAKMIKQHFRIK